MSNIRYNPIGWQLDTLHLRAAGTVITSDNYPADLRNAQHVTGITVGGSQPAGTYRYAAFKVNNVWGRITESGGFSAFAENKADIDTLEQFGNTPAELARLTDIPALAGKQFGTALGLISDDLNAGVPSMSMSFKCRNDTQTLSTSKYSPKYELGDGSAIAGITAEKEVSGGGEAEVYAQGVLEDGTLSGWQDLDYFTGRKVSELQLRADYRVPNTGGKAKASVTACQILYLDGSGPHIASAQGDLITKTLDWYMPLKQCRAVLKHTELENGSINMYAAIRYAPVSVRGAEIGIGTGSRATYSVGAGKGLSYDSFKLYFDREPVYADYELNGEAGRVTCTAPEGSIITCDYDWYGDKEVWEPMKLTARYDCDDYYKSEYRLSLPEGTKKAAALKAVITSGAGYEDDELIGSGTGKNRTYKLQHAVKDGQIKITFDGKPLPASMWKLQTDPHFIMVTAPAGAKLRASYDWIGDSPSISELMAVFS